MTEHRTVVIGGVDTHGRTHHAAAIDDLGRVLGSREFEVTAAGYNKLLGWLGRFGTLDRVGVEGTGTYGAGLCRFLVDRGVTVIEVERPDRRTRRQHGKSDPIDAEAAARAVLAGTATAPPKTRDGVIEAIRVLRTVRASAVRSRTAAINALHALVITAPDELRSTLDPLSRAALVKTCARLRPDLGQVGDACQATKLAVREIARRIEHLDIEIRGLDTVIVPLVRAAAPNTIALLGIGPDHAAQFLATAGGNPARLRCEAAFAHLCGASPIPASSGRTQRHRLHRGGDRDANRALHLAVVVQLRYCERTRAYVQRRMSFPRSCGHRA